MLKNKSFNEARPKGLACHTMGNISSKGYRGFSSTKRSPSFYEIQDRTRFCNQSPKISSNERRFGFSLGPHLFSYRDINEKVTDSHSTSLPLQYKRLSDEEVSNKFNVNYGATKKKYLNLYIKNTYGKNTNEDVNKKKYSVTEGDAKETINKKIENNINENKETVTIKKIPSIKERKIKTAVPTNRDTLNDIATHSLTSRNDKWKPEGYSHYELLVKHPILLKKELLANPITSRLPNISIKEIKEKGISSDIFFTKPIKENFHILASGYKDHQNSDIFLIKNDYTSFDKCGETYLFKPQKKEVYNVSRPSNSEWHAKNSMPTLLNHTSVNWSMTNPQNKSNSKTKAQIQIDCKEKAPTFNPIYRQKSLCEFIDLTRVGAPNPNRSYRECLNKTQECFRKRTDLCAAFDDIGHTYKDLCSAPFVKANPLS